MRRISKIMILTLLIFEFSSLFANPFLSNQAQYENSTNPLQSPTMSQVISNEDGVFLLVDDFWLCTEAFQTTGIDSFVMVEGEWTSLSKAVESGEGRLRSWKCKRCQRYNLEGVSGCAYCGKPRYE